jgi:acetate---CoA ligase (ADP-forming)
VLAADLADAAGVPFAPLSDLTRERVASLLDDGLQPANPLDVWGTGARTRELVGGCLTAVASDPAVGVTALAVDLVEELDEDEQYLDAVLDAHRAVNGPVAVLAPTAASVHQPYAARLRAADIPVLEGMSSGLRALGHLLDTRNRSGSRARGAAGVPVRELPDLAGPVDTAGALELLASAGVPVVATSRARTLTEAVGAAVGIGFPVALKTAGAAHKTEVGGVVLGLRDEAELRAAYDRLRPLGDEVLVQAMAPTGVELSLGVVRDAHLGPLVVLAAGGVLVELLAERAVALPPIDERQAGLLLDELPKVSALLDGHRGGGAADRGAVARAVVVVSQVALAWDRLEALDVNPLVCGPEGVLAVDALGPHPLTRRRHRASERCSSQRTPSRRPRSLT